MVDRTDLRHLDEAHLLRKSVAWQHGACQTWVCECTVGAIACGAAQSLSLALGPRSPGHGVTTWKSWNYMVESNDRMTLAPSLRHLLGHHCNSGACYNYTSPGAKVTGSPGHRLEKLELYGGVK